MQITVSNNSVLTAAAAYIPGQFLIMMFQEWIIAGYVFVNDQY